MQPIKRVFGRFPRVVRDLAKRLNKKLQVVMEGENTDLDKNLVEELSDPLIHLIRNSADHGVETPERRIAVGKDPKGTIKLGASQQGDSIILIIADDGAGIDKERVKQIAVERGVITPDEANRMSDTEAFNLIFAPGFSTTTETTDVSGRGVGMDVVKTKITQLNGSITIDSEKDVGTTITIKVPLTLAIMPTLTVRVASQIFALPLANVKEILSLDGRPTNNVENRRMLPLRDRTIPIYYLKHWLIEGANTFDNPDTGHVVVVQVGEIQIGFIVDGLIGQEEVVIKPLGDAFRDTPGLAGATITGNGKVSIILDLQDLIQANT
jgi:two-component system chemotaxis sensor kinase CheA